MAMAQDNDYVMVKAQDNSNEMDCLAALMEDLRPTTNKTSSIENSSEATTAATIDIASIQPANNGGKSAEEENKDAPTEDSKSESAKSSDEQVQDSSPIDFSNIMSNPMPTIDKKKKSKDEIKPVFIRSVAPYSTIVAAQHSSGFWEESFGDHLGAWRNVADDFSDYRGFPQLKAELDTLKEAGKLKGSVGDLIITILAIYLLENFHKADEKEWQMIVKKAKKFL